MSWFPVHISILSYISPSRTTQVHINYDLQSKTTNTSDSNLDPIQSNPTNQTTITLISINTYQQQQPFSQTPPSPTTQPSSSIHSHSPDSSGPPRGSAHPPPEAWASGSACPICILCEFSSCAAEKTCCVVGVVCHGLVRGEMVCVRWARHGFR